MFCSNCGKEVDGNFCSNCGNKIEDSSNDMVEAEESLTCINGVNVDLSEIMKINGKNKINAIKDLKNLTGVGLREAKSIIDDFYKDNKPQEEKMGFWEKLNQQADLAKKKQIEEKYAKEEKIKQLKKDGTAYCPKCYSTSLSADKKGFGVGKAVIGAAITGPIGLVAGNIGSKKIRVTCINCGHKFWAGKK